MIKHYYYLAHDGGVFRIHAKQKPSARYKRGMWPAFEPYTVGEVIEWHAGWEITWRTLQKQTYIGCVTHSPA